MLPSVGARRARSSAGGGGEGKPRLRDVSPAPARGWGIFAIIFPLRIPSPGLSAPRSPAGPCSAVFLHPTLRTQCPGGAGGSPLGLKAAHKHPQEHFPLLIAPQKFRGGCDTQPKSQLQAVALSPSPHAGAMDARGRKGHPPSSSSSPSSSSTIPIAPHPRGGCGQDLFPLLPLRGRYGDAQSDAGSEIGDF